VAEYLSRNNPTAKLLILDSNERFSKQSLFQSAWDQRYGDMVEWRSASNDGRVTRVDADSMQLFTDFEDIRADVINVVPPQQAGGIAARAGVADATGWCPIDARDFSSTLQANVHVIGDATIAAPMPKSAFSANAQAKICAIQIARSLAGLDVEATTLANTCYSFLSPDEAISVSGVYRSDQGRFSNVAGAGGVSPLQPEAGFPEREAGQARAWFARITRETFG
jgi:NADPH-dependent 2,4-dienoyl-CoA reductase/sulfur reductase-like enzyme